MASVKQQWKLGLLKVVLLALLLSQASLLFRRASARALEVDRKLLAATDEVTNQITKKETEIPTTKDASMGSNHYGGGGGGGWDNHGGSWGNHGGDWGHHGGGGGWGHGGGGWEHRDAKTP